MGAWNWLGRNGANVLGQVGQLAPKGSGTRQDADWVLNEVRKERDEIAAKKAQHKKRR